MKLQLSLLLSAIWSLTSANVVIESPHETNYGTWGVWDRCPFGTFVQAMQILTEPFQGIGPLQDDTAMNAIRLYCGDPFNASTTMITSKQGAWGSWGSVYTCRSDDRPIAPDGYVTGFQIRSEPSMGSADDSATNNIRVFCNYPNLLIPEQTREADGLSFGSWTEAQHCYLNQNVCALQTQTEDYQGDGDDTAMNNIKMECCDR